MPEQPAKFDSLGVSFGNTSALPQLFTDNEFQYKDDMSIVKGKHAFKFGGEYRRIRNGSSFESAKNGVFIPYSTEELLTDGFFGDVADQLLDGGIVAGSFLEAVASLNPQTGGFPVFHRSQRATE